MRRNKRHAIVQNEKQYVNTGKMTARNINTNTVGDGDKNCSLCSAAGVVNLSLGKDLWTSGMVAGSLATSDSKSGMGDDADVQVANIKEFCEAMTGRFAAILGSMNHEVDSGSASDFMLSFPDGTVFAVMLSGGRRSGGEGRLAGSGVTHWLNAISQGGQIEYVDFQASQSIRQRQTTRGDMPMLGIKGETVDNPNMIVIAFPPN